jgi:DNA invertase Pin-like site-specific DNA recombinase
MSKRVGLYLRVSTGDQTVENQRQALRAAAEHRGWTVVEEFVDAGISGAKGREKRPGFDRLLKAVTRRKVDVVAAWSSIASAGACRTSWASLGS